jgi:hypothetical protein
MSIDITIERDEWSLEIEGECTDGGTVQTWEEPGSGPEFEVTAVKIVKGDAEIVMEPSFLDEIGHMKEAIEALEEAWRKGDDYDIDETTNPATFRRHMKARRAVGRH